MNKASIDAYEVYRKCWCEARMSVVSMVNGKRIDLIADQVYIMLIAEANNCL